MSIMFPHLQCYTDTTRHRLREGACFVCVTIQYIYIVLLGELPTLLGVFGVRVHYYSRLRATQQWMP